MTKEPIPYIPLSMSHHDLGMSPVVPLPQGYSLRLFRPGDGEHWAAITVDAGEFATKAEALDYFNGHFGAHLHLLPERCLFLLDDSGCPVGTATGWFIDEDPAVGRLHWVAIARPHQGRGLCRPLVAASMGLMRRLGHEKAMLTTQPKSWKAIKVYLDFGWKPHKDDTGNYLNGWALINGLICHSELAGF